MKSILLAILPLLIASTAYSAKLDKLGQRAMECQNTEGDDFIIEFDKSFVREAKNHLHDDKLDMAILPSAGCLRVGTEVRLNLAGEEIFYVGKALINSIEVVKQKSLLLRKLPFTKSSIQGFLKSNREKDYAIVRFKHFEKVEETMLTEQYDRLNTCFPTYADWRSMRLKDGQESLVTSIQKRKTKAQIWNGTFNCYKVGIRAAITIPSKKGENLGNIIPTELHLVHYTNLKRKHARILGKSLSKLKEEMAVNKEIDGGYTTMVVFDYEKERPPKPEVEEE